MVLPVAVGLGNVASRLSSSGIVEQSNVNNFLDMYSRSSLSLLKQPTRVAVITARSRAMKEAA